MTNHLQSQGSGLVIGINAFAPMVERLIHEFKAKEFLDWPTVILTQTLQSTALSLFKLLPAINESNQLLDTRSIATLVRNLVDTHDVIDAMVGSQTTEEHTLNRQILGYYIAGRIAHIQQSIDSEAAQKFFPLAKATYWENIEQSPLFDKKKMAKLKSGESVFYRTRTERVQTACGSHAAFVAGLLADLSTFVHSIPPSLWVSPSNDVYADTEHARDRCAVWLRVANYYYARSISVILSATNYNASGELAEFLAHHNEVFTS
jgi:hypothetical protein